jgi:hypothetical protein
MKLFFRFKPRVSTAERERIVRRMRRGGAKGIKPLLDRAPTPALAAVWVADAGTAASANSLLDLLTAEAAVEHAEKEVSRRPMGGRGGKKPD